MLITSIFSFSHNVFYPSQTKCEFFIHIYCVVCKCFQFGPVKDCVVWKRVKSVEAKVKAISDFLLQIRSLYRCIYMLFPFENFPNHVKMLRAYAWKPLAIQVWAALFVFNMFTPFFFLFINITAIYSNVCSLKGG